MQFRLLGSEKNVSRVSPSSSNFSNLRINLRSPIEHSAEKIRSLFFFVVDLRVCYLIIVTGSVKRVLLIFRKKLAETSGDLEVCAAVDCGERLQKWRDTSSMAPSASPQGGSLVWLSLQDEPFGNEQGQGSQRTQLRNGAYPLCMSATTYLAFPHFLLYSIFSTENYSTAIL